MFSASSTFSLGVKVDSRSATLCVPLSKARLGAQMSCRPAGVLLVRGSSPEWHVLRVPNEEDPLAALLEEEAIAALLVVPEAVGVDVREEVRGRASVAVGVRLKVEGHDS